jgi:hypothetical protein
VHSFLAQAEYAGVIMSGLAITLVADWRASLALATCAALFVITIVLIQCCSSRDSA